MAKKKMLLHERISRHLETRDKILLELKTEGPQLIDRLHRMDSLRSIAKQIGASYPMLSAMRLGRMPVSMEMYVRLWEARRKLIPAPGPKPREHTPRVDEEVETD